MANQRYVIVTLLEPRQEGDEFSPEFYPLHISVVPSFQLSHMDSHTLTDITRLCSTTRAMTATAGSEEYFGPDNEVHVTTILITDELRQLHDQLVEILTAAGATFDEPQYMGENYRPHATVQASARLRTGSTVTIKAITVIDKLPNGNAAKRRVFRTLLLKG